MTTATQPRADELDLILADLQDIYDYLDRLRESGVTNMLGAGVYLQDEFDMERQFANKVLGAWMKDFSQSGGQDD